MRLLSFTYLVFLLVSFQVKIIMNVTSILPTIYHEQSKIIFSWFDYVLFSGMLGLSVLIGIYFGCCGKKQNTTEDYLLGGKSMNILPIAVSLVASHISGITILAVPADVYKYGSNYWWLCVSIIIICIFVSYVYLPVFFKLQFTSMYEYLDARFDRSVRLLASFLFTLAIFLYNPVVVYIPALAFSQATGINLHLITPIVCVVCIFYTTIGGLKAVVWTDTLQFGGMIGSIVAVFFIGAASAGGFGNVWEKAVEGRRLDLFDFTFDPTVRDGFWALIIGGTVHWTSLIGMNQGSVQKFLAVPTLQHARKAIGIYCIGMIIMNSLSIFTGDIIYAKYENCDPVSSKQITRNDQILPYFVIDVAGKIWGLPGIFIAGVFSAALSTLSATLNTVSGTIYEDFLSPFFPNISQKQASNILKLIVIIAGAICTILVFVVEQMSGLLPFAVACQGITGGPLLGLFTLGMLFPSANSKGALIGGITSLLFSSVIVFTNQWYKIQGLIEDVAKPVSTDGCDLYVNITSPKPLPVNQPFVLFRLSFWYTTLMGNVVVIIIGLIVSWLTKKHNQDVHPDLISPVVHFLLPEREKDAISAADYYSVTKALRVVVINSQEEEKK